MSDFFNNDDIVSSVDSSRADIISKLDQLSVNLASQVEELEKRINKIFEIVEELESR